MWHRVGGAISCAVCLLLSCGKSERGAPTADGGSAGTDTGGVSTSGSGAGTGGAGSEVAMGGRPASGGNATSLGGSAAAIGGNATSSGGSVAATGGNATSLGGNAAASGGLAAGGAPETGGESGGGGAPSCNGTYHACGCGCCAGQDTTVRCVYPVLGQSLSSIIAADMAVSHDAAACASAGCSKSVDYVCCESPAHSAEQATYMTSLVIGDIGRIHIDKTAAPDCSRLTLRQHLPSDPAQPVFPAEMPAGWEIEYGLRSPCSSSMTRPRAIGAIGGVSLRVLGNACVVDVHLTLFFGDAENGVDAERFDADAMPIGLALVECH